LGSEIRFFGDLKEGFWGIEIGSFGGGGRGLK